MKLDLGRWRTLAGYGAFAAARDVPLFVQTSGGRTSAFMAAMAPDESVLTFQNTGREHEKTLEFLREIADAFEREIVWLEFRPPRRKGAPPREFGWARVDFKTAARKGEPIAEFMEAINAYRDGVGKPPVAPWARGRLCTVHVKHRVLDHYLRDLGIEAHDRWIGLRADEPERVYGLRKQSTIDRHLIAPLAGAGVTKSDVLEFWARQPFDLGIEEHEGNCDGCFLKDQADVSRAIGERPEAIEFWGALQEKYPRFGGINFAGYRKLAAELPARLAIERSLRGGAPLAADEVRDIEPRRLRLIMAQETKRHRFGASQFSCACEASMVDEEEGEDEAPRMPAQMSLGIGGAP